MLQSKYLQQNTNPNQLGFNMAPSPITEDYYMILEVQQNATSDQITKAYRRLALKLHPDRSAEGGSTQAFQLVSDSPNI